MDIDIEAASSRIRTLKRRAEYWREIPVPPELLRALELVHAVRSTPAKAAGKPLWPWSRATAHRKIARTMADVGVEEPQACAKGLQHGFGIATVAASIPPTTIAAALGAKSRNLQPWATPTCRDHRGLHHRREHRDAGFSGQDVKSGGEFGRIRCLKASGEGPVARMACSVARKIGPPCELRALPGPQETGI